MRPGLLSSPRWRLCLDKAIWGWLCECPIPHRPLDYTYDLAYPVASSVTASIRVSLKAQRLDPGLPYLDQTLWQLVECRKCLGNVSTESAAGKSRLAMLLAGSR
ncbi:hypothetical protein MiSe_00600 [Microseira wollei NIES-4236]|uniref:Uncharacterized protein n=1 Tax=Microseira wollei NIES-4236 TaxID=2530354 RepID=A0AAV3WZM3_9CYAN|nr:hypothetical protein MiSe_00600 [Microseira wollei NIES-4236]